MATRRIIIAALLTLVASVSKGVAVDSSDPNLQNFVDGGGKSTAMSAYGGCENAACPTCCMNSLKNSGPKVGTTSFDQISSGNEISH